MFLALECLDDKPEALRVLLKLGADGFEPPSGLGLTSLVEVMRISLKLTAPAFSLPRQRQHERDERPEEASKQPGPEAVAAISPEDEEGCEQPDRE